MPDQRKNSTTIVLLAVWAGLFIWSFIQFSITEPTGDSFTRGLNRVTGFLGWQLAAGLVAVPVFFLGRGHPRGSGLRWASRLPAAAALALVLAIVGFIVWGNYFA
ncbi:hypothetical protein [Oricola indica]|uniref:hypothetical protein n=1 Tax=Oricola indica TaxID=2872591 RepID=UPI003CCB959A